MLSISVGEGLGVAVGVGVGDTVCDGVGTAETAGPAMQPARTMASAAMTEIGRRREEEWSGNLMVTALPSGSLAGNTAQGVVFSRWLA